MQLSQVVYAQKWLVRWLHRELVRAVEAQEDFPESDVCRCLFGTHHLKHVIKRTHYNLDVNGLGTLHATVPIFVNSTSLLAF